MGGGVYHTGAGAAAINNSCILDNTAFTYSGIIGDNGALVDATNNWWGSAEGPTHVDEALESVVNGNVNFAPALPSNTLNCPTAPVHDDAQPL